jgi:hypothetical protein
MGSSHYTIRKMSRDEINIAVDWAASEGWNPACSAKVCDRAMAWTGGEVWDQV